MNGAAQTVTKDRFAQWGWMWRRTWRLAQLLTHPHILQATLDLVQAMDRYCELNDIPEDQIAIGDAKFIRGLDYVEYPLTRT